MIRVIANIQTHWEDERGAELVEYVILAALIAIVAIVAVVFLANNLSASLSDTGQSVHNA